MCEGGREGRGVLNPRAGRRRSRGRGDVGWGLWGWRKVGAAGSGRRSSRYGGESVPSGRGSFSACLLDVNPRAAALAEGRWWGSGTGWIWGWGLGDGAFVGGSLRRPGGEGSLGGDRGCAGGSSAADYVLVTFLPSDAFEARAVARGSDFARFAAVGLPGGWSPVGRG